MFVTKKRYEALVRRQLATLNESRQRASDLHTLQEKYDNVVHDLQATIAQAALFRAEYERLNSSPEIKADTEAAFLRGEKSGRSKFAAWLVSEAYRVTADDDTDPEVTVEGVQTLEFRPVG